MNSVDNEIKEINDINELDSKEKEILLEALDYELEFIKNEKVSIEKEIDKYKTFIEENNKKLLEIENEKLNFDICEKKRLSCEVLNKKMPFKMKYMRKAVINFMFKNVKSPIFGATIAQEKNKTYLENIQKLEDRLKDIIEEHEFLLNLKI